MKHIITAIALAAASPAAACDIIPDGVAVLVGSNHVGATQDFNERHDGLFASWNCEYADIRAGAYTNSFDRTSWTVSVASDYVSLSAGGFNAGAFVAVAHYPGHGNGKPTNIGGDWIVLGGVEFTHDDIPLFVQLIPGDSDSFDYLVTAGLTFEFGGR